MNSEHDNVVDLSAAALRMRRYRERIKTGKVVVLPIAVDERLLEFLADTGLLPPDCEDPTMVTKAVERYFEVFCKRLREEDERK